MSLGVLLMAGFLALLYFWHRGVQQRTRELETELRRSQVEWQRTTPAVDEARRARARFHSFAVQAARVTEECRSRPMSSALRALVQSVSGNVQLRDVRFARLSGDPERYSLSIVGFVSSRAPRADADTFRLEVQSRLDKALGTTVLAQFQALNDIAATETQADASASFTIVATSVPAPDANRPSKRGD